MTKTERQKEIVAVLMQNKSMKVEELSKLFDVSGVTIRTDLDALEAKGLLIRIHGGALSAENQKFIRFTSDTRMEEKEEKSKICQAASALINQGETILIDSGSTTVGLCKYLSNKGLTVITNSLLIINELMYDESVELIILPGTLRRYSMGMIGPLTKNTLEQIRVNTLFMGASALSPEGVWSSNLVEADTKRSMLKVADKICLMADSKKFSLSSFGKICSWTSIDYLITDSIQDNLRRNLENLGIKIIIA